MEKVIIIKPGKPMEIVPFNQEVIQLVCGDSNPDIIQMSQQYVLIANPNAKKYGQPLNFTTKYGREIYGPAFVGRISVNEIAGLDDAEALWLFTSLEKQ